ncbi:hypothetical protein K1719_009619 [Acacia pycnantha]|nr:hypothetical protein K1719_009619 [Acacia pycnantha]
MLNSWCVFKGFLVALHWKTVGGMWDGSSVLCGANLYSRNNTQESSRGIYSNSSEYLIFLSSYKYSDPHTLDGLRCGLSDCRIFRWSLESIVLVYVNNRVIIENLMKCQRGTTQSRSSLELLYSTVL